MKEDGKKIKSLTILLSSKEYERIRKDYSQTMKDSMSGYGRDMLLKKPLIGTYKDTGMQELLAGLAGLRKELHGYACDYSILEKKICSVDCCSRDSRMLKIRELQKCILDTLDSLNQLINQTAEKWLRS